MIIVTGGAGFIGSAVVWGLNQCQIDNVMIVDHLGTDPEKWKNLRSLKFRDYLEKDIFRQYVQEQRFNPKVIQAIIHMGACSSTTEQDASFLIDNNFQYSKELAVYAVKNQIRFIYASSAATYGAGELGYDDDHDQLDSLRPLNMYGYSKQLFDQWADRQKYLSKIVGLKFSNVFGPNEYHKGDMRSVIHKAFEQIRKTGTVQLFKSHNPQYQDGEQMRDFIYIKSAVAYTLFFLDHLEVNGIFNVGSGSANTWNDLIAAVFEALELPSRIEYIDMPEALRDNYQYFTELPMQKMQDSGCDYSPISLSDAVREYVQDYLLCDRHLGDENMA